MGNKGASSTPNDDLILDSNVQNPTNCKDVKVELEVKCTTEIEEIKDDTKDVEVKNIAESAEIKSDTESGELKTDTEGLEVVEGYLDSSIEEMDPSSPVVTLSGDSQEQEGMCVCVWISLLSCHDV